MDPITPKEGWHVLHQIYSFNYAAWEDLESSRRDSLLKSFHQTVDEIRGTKDTQLLLYSVVGSGDLGSLLVGPDLNQVDQQSKDLQRAFGPETLELDYSFLSLTEESEYKITDEEWETTLEQEEGLTRGTPEFEERMTSFRDRMAKYRHDRIYPQFTDWKCVCFYPMLKRRSGNENWYALTYEKRRELMGGHARVGRQYAGRIKQLITGSTGLSDWEWGVTLFSNSIDEFKAIIYEMRFDEVSHQYAEFGPFYIGILLSPEDLLQRLRL